MVEHLAYNERVSGSNPLLFTQRKSSSVVRVLACHAKCRGFESRFFRKLKNTCMNSLFYCEITKIGLLFMVAVILSVIIIFGSYSFSIAAPDTEKVSAYECGFDPYEDARNTFDVRFYLVAVLFIIFDLEAVYFFPWCVSVSFLSTEGMWSMIDFIVELLVGYYYAWEAGALDWE